MILPKNRLLWLECLLLFGALPLGISLMKPHGWIYLMLWVAAALAWHGLSRFHGYRFRHEWNISALNRKNILFMLARLMPCAALLFLFAWFMIPDRLLSLPLQRPDRWLLVMLLYPPLSALPQEIIFRSYFFCRFAGCFKTDRAMLIASALAFGWVHIVLQNWVAVVFSFIGGLIFGDTYRRTHSLAAVCLEHALYGCTLFTFGLGFYFYHGMAVR